MIVNKVTLLGHKDHGKSTLIGNMLIVTGAVSKQRINEAKKTSKKLGRRFEPGYILDSFEEERRGEMTIDTTRAQIRYKDSAFEFIDVPGHEELIKNMISGASYANFALLVVSAKSGEGIKPQTKRHIFLARMMGINRIVIGVNKMDTVGYDESAFNRIKKDISEFIGRIGISKSEIYFIPISAYNSENILKPSKNLKWYKGRPLFEVMRELVQSKSENKAGDFLRIILQGTIPYENDRKIIGNIISGTVKAGEQIIIMPLGTASSIKNIFVKGSRRNKAQAGENVALSLDKPVNGEVRGCVLYDAEKARKAVDSIEATIFLARELGSDAEIKFNGNEIPGKVAIKHIIDTTTGLRQEQKKGNHSLNAADVSIKLKSRIPAEPFESSKELGRFVIYEKKEFAGIGIITR